MNLHRLKKHQRKIVQQRTDALAEAARAAAELATARDATETWRLFAEELRAKLQQEHGERLAQAEQASTREKALREERDAAVARAQKLEADNLLPDVKKLRERLRLKSELVDNIRRQLRQQDALLLQAGLALQHANRDMKLLGKEPAAPAEPAGETT